MGNETGSTLKDWLEQSRTAFDVVACKRHELPDDCIILDPASIDGIWRDATPEWVGALPLDNASMGLQHIAYRVARRLATAHARQMDVSIRGLAHAWFNPIFSELTTLFPMRHMARKIAANHDGRVIVIPLPSRSITVVNFWAHNAMEPLFLAYQLRRNGIPVVLFSEQEGTPELQFRLSKTWVPKAYPEVLRDKAFTRVTYKSAIRGRQYVKKQAKTTHKHKPGVFSAERYFGINRHPACLTLSLTTAPTFGPVRVYSAPQDTPSWHHGFMELMGPVTQNVTQWYRRAFDNRTLREAHIADCATFEGGLLAAEVTRRGGQIHIWPHSANLVHNFLYAPKDVAGVSVVAKSTGIHWAKTMPPARIRIDKQSVIPNTTRPPAFDINRPLHVVLFAGAHALGRLPLFDYQRHIATWARVLNDFQNSGIHLTIKHKSTFESRAWISSLAPDGAKLHFDRTHANNLKLPNMIFMSISATSTALLEGMARGIPGIVVRDFPVEETPYYDPEFVPCLPSDKAIDFISELKSKMAFDDLRERQRIWFERETDPSHVFEPD